MFEIEASKWPKIVNVYRRRYEAMSKSEYKHAFKQYADCVLKDTFEGLDWKALLAWEHRHLEYTRGQLPIPRAEMPIDIVKQSKGRCGEFALLYNGLLLAQEYKCRIIIDCSTLKDKSKTAAGDHVWNEICVDGLWMHVDPTEKRVNQPLLYAQGWNKDLNLVYAIDERATSDVTSTYRA